MNDNYVDITTFAVAHLKPTKISVFENSAINICCYAKTFKTIKPKKPKTKVDLNFIKCGFEFTAGVKKGKDNKIAQKFKQSLKLYSDGYTLYNQHNCKLPTNEWINDNFESDSCGLEISTPIVNNLKEVSTYFNDFKEFTEEANITIDSEKSKYCLGGCHIHMDVSNIPKKLLSKFIINLCIFFSNNPQLNWGFNDPNDNENANSFLNKYENLFQVNTSNITALDYLSKKSMASHYFIKRYAIRYNNGYQTVEFRILDMPTDLEQHLLHYELVTNIYKHCLDLAKDNKKIKLEYRQMSDYKFRVDESIMKFCKTIELLNINPNRCGKMIENIKLRYYWNDLHEDNYLL